MPARSIRYLAAVVGSGETFNMNATTGGHPDAGAPPTMALLIFAIQRKTVRSK
jgi:hypothetical protein